MLLHKLYLQNFRCFGEIEVEFLSKFNVIIGDNGVGKSSLMEGICMAVSSFFLGIDTAIPRRFVKNDARYLNFHHKPEYQFPIILSANGDVNGQTIDWEMNQSGRGKPTNTNYAKPIKEIAQALQNAVRKGERADLPVIAFFGANRLWENPEKEDEEKIDIAAEGSRLEEGYKNAIRPIANYKLLKSWFINKELAVLQAKQKGFDIPAEVEVVKNAIAGCIENCAEVYYSFETKALVMKMTDARIIRWNNLSDGQKNMLAIVADIAYRCINLNPHLGLNALQSKGVVLIDELDVHLHPNWQKKIGNMIKTTFPNIQFIVTTHSPLILHSLMHGDRIISLEDSKAYYFDDRFGRDIDDTLAQLMNSKVENKALEHYLTMIELGNGETEDAKKLRKKIEEQVGSDYKDLAKADALLMFYEKRGN